MSCCSRQRRSAARSPFRPLVVAPAKPVAAAKDSELRYLGRHPLALKGPATRKLYRIGPGQRIVAVDPADVAAMLRSGLFEPV